MSALGRNYRIRAWNTQNQAVTVEVIARRWKFGTDGSITDDATESTLLASVSCDASSVANSSRVGGNIDNSANADKWLGANLTVAFTAAATTNATGTVSLFLQQSTDGGTTWPAAGGAQMPGGILIGAYNVTVADATTLTRRNFRIR